MAISSEAGGKYLRSKSLSNWAPPEKITSTARPRICSAFKTRHIPAYDKTCHYRASQAKFNSQLVELMESLKFELADYPHAAIKFKALELIKKFGARIEHIRLFTLHVPKALFVLPMNKEVLLCMRYSSSPPERNDLFSCDCSLKYNSMKLRFLPPFSRVCSHLSFVIAAMKMFLHFYDFSNLVVKSSAIAWNCSIRYPLTLIVFIAP